MEPIVIDAEDVQKYTRKDPLNLECRTEALPIDIVINNFSVPDIGLMKKNGYKKDEYGNYTCCFSRGESDFVGGAVNNLYDIKISYLCNTGVLRIFILLGMDSRCCEIKNRKVVIPIFLAGKIDFCVRFSCPKELCTQYIESLLAVDLGNTRSCALLCNDIRDITHHNGFQINKLPLYSYTDNQISDIGVFDSFISFSKASANSFVRIGKEAIPVANTLRGLKDRGDFYLSSPKRYFWDNDENLNCWKVLNEGKNIISLCEIPFAQRLVQEFNLTDADVLSRSAMLASMLIEILEQAENYINGSSSRSASSLPRVISHVCVTYPAGWSEQERKKYQEVLQAAVNIYQSSKCPEFPRITLDVSCDEATAVLLCYIYGEVAKYSGCADAWLKAIGRTSLYDATETHARVAVIDVGGGTSDLAIVNIQNKKSGAGLSLQIDKLYKDGTNKAGDLLLQKITERILVEKIALGTISSTAPRDVKASYVSQFSQRLNTLSTDARVKQLTRRFWFPLAINFIAAVNGNQSTVKLPDSLSLLIEIIKEHAGEWTSNNVNEDFSEITVTEADKRVFNKVVTMTFRDTAKLFGAAIYAFDADLVILSGKTTETPQVSQVFQKYCCLPDSRFIPMWNYLIGDWCTVADAGKITDSKYTTAIGAVLYDVVNNNFPIQSLEASIHTQNAQGLNDGNCQWGIANNGDFWNILNPGCNECWIPFSGRPKLLARRRFDVDITEAPISYELRFKPFKKRVEKWEQLRQKYGACMQEIFDIKFDDEGIPSDEYLLVKENRKGLRIPKITVTLGYDAADDTRTALVVTDVKGLYEDGTSVTKDDIHLYTKPKDRQLRDSINVKLHLQTDSYARATICIAEVNGKYADGALVNKDDLEIRIRTSREELFWLDSGKI